MSSKALHILEAVASNGGPTTPAFLRERTGLPPATMTRLLGELVALGYLERISRGRYVPGGRATGISEASVRATAARERKPFVVYAPPQGICEAVFAGVDAVCRREARRAVLQPIANGMGHFHDHLAASGHEWSGAVVVSHGSLGSGAGRRRRAKDLPMVHVGYLGYDICDTITWDQRFAYSRMTERLIDRGCRVIVYLGPEGPQHIGGFRARIAGYEEAMREHGLAPSTCIVDNRFFSSRKGSLELARMVGGAGDGQRPAILLSHDAKLESVVAMLAAQGFRPGRDVLVCSVFRGWARSDLADVIPQLTLCVEEPWEDVGRTAAQQLLARLADNGGEPRQVLVRPEIVENWAD
jgi:DNA-binding LacI/PurR family transcriptional regulator